MAKGRKTGGRKAGTPNKVTAAVKDAILQAFQNVGGVEYLETVAKEDQKAFCALLGKVLPKDLTLGSDPDNPPRLEVILTDPTRPDDP